MKNSLTLSAALAIFILVCGANTAISDSDSGYGIKPNDGLKTYVFGNPDLNVNTVVPPDGMMTFPLVGEVSVLGITGEQLGLLLMEKLAYYIVDPKVNVFVTAYNPLKVYILGSVRNPGAYTFKPGQRLTDYLAEAGSFDERVDMKKCYVYSAIEGQEAKVFDLKVLLESNKTGLDIELEPFDTVYIKKKSGFIFTEWRDVADALNIIVGLSTLYFVISTR